MEKKKEIEETETAEDWRAVLKRLNDQVKQIEALPKVKDEAPEVKNQVDIKTQYRRIKIEEQCKKLNPKVNLPSRSSWRDRIYGNSTAKDSELDDLNLIKESPIVRRKKHSWERRTRIYFVDSSIDINGLKIKDTIHQKRMQIEAKLAECNQSHQEKGKPKTIPMLTYPGFEKLIFTKAFEISEKEMKNEETNSMDFDALGLKKNTLRKMSILKEFNKITSGVEIIKKVEPPPTTKKNYSTSVDWREELKNKEKAKQLAAMAGYTMGMPDYKEPEAKPDETNEDIPKPENKWAKAGKTWEKVKLKPTRHVDMIKENNTQDDDPFKINLRPVGDRNKVNPKLKPPKLDSDTMKIDQHQTKTSRRHKR